MKNIDASDCKEMAGHLMGKGYDINELPELVDDLHELAVKEGYKEGPHFGAFGRDKEYESHKRSQVFYVVIVVVALLALWALNS